MADALSTLRQLFGTPAGQPTGFQAPRSTATSGVDPASSRTPRPGQPLPPGASVRWENGVPIMSAQPGVQYGEPGPVTAPDNELVDASRRGAQGITDPLIQGIDQSRLAIANRNAVGAQLFANAQNRALNQEGQDPMQAQTMLRALTAPSNQMMLAYFRQYLANAFGQPLPQPAPTPAPENQLATLSR